MKTITPEVKDILTNALTYARIQKAEYVVPEHIALSALRHIEARKYFAIYIDVEKVENLLDSHLKSVFNDNCLDDPLESQALEDIIYKAMDDTMDYQDLVEALRLGETQYLSYLCEKYPNVDKQAQWIKEDALHGVATLLEKSETNSLRNLLGK